MRKYLAEVAGTFALVFMGTGAIVVDKTSGLLGPLGVALVFGIIILGMIYAFGDISGAHFNPAVTIGFVVAGRFDAKEILPYITSQLIGALAASGLLRVMFWDRFFDLGATMPSGKFNSPFPLSMGIEVVLTFFLMLLVLRVSTGSKEKGTMAGLAIGAYVALAALFGGPICGASMNPARSFGPAIFYFPALSVLWIYFVFPILGATLAALLDRFVFCDGTCRRPPEE